MALRGLLCPLLSLLLAGPAPTPLVCRQEPAATTASSITLLALNQPPCTAPSRESVLTARLAYQIGAQEQSEHGFEVSIKFQTIHPQRTFSVGSAGRIRLVSRHDTLTLRYPMAAIWSNPQLQRPLTCYLYLHRNLGEGRSSVIARTPPIVFRECL